MTSVYQMMRDNDIDEIDVSDDSFDVTCAWNLPIAGSDDRNYNAVVEFILRNTEAKELVDQDRYEWIIADITGFVEANYDALVRFTADCCREAMDHHNRDDNLYVGVRTVNGLMIGGFDEGDYRNFLWLVGSRAGAGRSRPSSARRKASGDDHAKAAVRSRAASKSQKRNSPKKKAPTRKTKGAKR